MEGIAAEITATQLTSACMWTMIAYTDGANRSLKVPREDTGRFGELLA
jgi:hypothetical protein